MYKNNKQHNKLVFSSITLVIIISITLCILSASATNENNGIGTKSISAVAVQSHSVSEKNLIESGLTNGTELPLAVPAPTAKTKPGLMGFKTDIMVNGKIARTYSRPAPISFNSGSEYTELEGIITFRGNNYREGATYGTAEIKDKKFDRKYWQFHTGSMPKNVAKGIWSGSGWTGQPLIVRWPDKTKAVMNMKKEKKNKTDLVEVIYATMDGNVYFLDLDDGSETRSKLKIGLPFKGAGSLDPRGIPILYLGAGDSAPHNGGAARYVVYSLINFSKLYEFGANDPFSLRKWFAFDSASLVDASSDTLIEPGECGILYTIKLNTTYDNNTGKLAMKPSETVKWRYDTNRTSKNRIWRGMEDSAVAWKNYIFVGDNAGNMMCLDLNTMKLAWSQDILDDTNASPVFEESSAGKSPSLYVAPSLHWTAKGQNKTGTIPIFKLDAITGEVIWKTSYKCYTVSGVSGGVQATPVLGKNIISDLIIYPVARIPNAGTGILVALNKETGKEVWHYDMKYYAWSSPVAIYTNDSAYIVQCDTMGNMFLLEGKTGKLLDSINLGSNIEASPAVFDNTIVVGTRGQKIFGIKLK